MAEPNEAVRQIFTQLLAKRFGIPVNVLAVAGMVAWFILVDAPQTALRVYAVITLVFALFGLAAGLYALRRPVKRVWPIEMMILSILIDISLGGQVLFAALFGA